MARYTNLFTAIGSTLDLKQSVMRVFQDCGLSLVYETKDYLVAKEKPGQVAFSKLATVEVLINPTVNDEIDARVNLVVKNEELPIHRDNHCQQVFSTVNQAIASIDAWNPA